MEDCAVLDQVAECAEREKSTHRVEVVPVRLEKHPNADRLSIASVFGFTCVVNSEQWAGKTLAAFIPPDSLVPINREEFSFLADKAKSDGMARIKAMKIRGVLSFGLLIPAPDGAQEGDDVAELLGVKHYEPAIGGNKDRGGLFMGSEVAKAPNVYHVKYDIDSGRRFAADVFTAGESVYVTEKIHGANARYVWHDGRLHCSSRTEWKKEYPDYDHVTVDSLLATGKVDAQRAEEIVARLRSQPKQKNIWWQTVDKHPEIREFCERNPGVVLYGEVYGAVQDLTYGHIKGDISFAAFDMLSDGKWLNPDTFMEACQRYGVPMVPVMAWPMPFDFDRICAMAEGQSTVIGAKNVREGVVVKPAVERWYPTIGRVVLKWVGAGYLEKSKG